MNVAEQGRILIYGVDGSPDIKKELKKTENQIAGTVHSLQSVWEKMLQIQFLTF